jgi:hypothetical protein
MTARLMYVMATLALIAAALAPIASAHGGDNGGW